MSAGSDRLAKDLEVESLSGPARALAEEAVRMKARLDQLDGWIRGTSKHWFVLGNMLDGQVELVINAPMGEARQTALALKGILAELRQVMANAPAAPVASVADDLKKRREDRRAKAAGE